MSKVEKGTVTEKTLEDIKKEIAEVIREQQEDNAFRESLVEVLQDASDVIAFDAKASNLAIAIGILEMEEIEVPDAAFLKTEEYDYHMEELVANLSEKLDIALSEMKQEHMLKFAQAYFNIANVPNFKYIVEIMNDEQKEKVYDVLRSETFRNDYDNNLAWRFEKELNYSLKFAKEKGIFTLTEELKPFEEFLDKYVKVYAEQIPPTIEWLKTLADLNLNEKLIVRYADAAVRRLKIGENHEDPIYKEAHQDFTKILNELK